MEFADFRPVVYLESITSSLFLETTALEPDGIIWRTSSYSYRSGACVEVGWRTSSYSYDSGNCVEVAPGPGAVLVRDSKNRTGPALSVPAAAWQSFLTTLPR